MKKMFIVEVKLLFHTEPEGTVSGDKTQKLYFLF